MASTWVRCDPVRPGWASDQGFQRGVRHVQDRRRAYRKNKAALRAFTADHAGAIDRELALLFLFERQWADLRAYAKDRGVEIFGDLPIYVALDSVDVWSAPEGFALDADLNPREVANTSESVCPREVKPHRSRLGCPTPWWFKTAHPSWSTSPMMAPPGTARTWSRPSRPDSRPSSASRLGAKRCPQRQTLTEDRRRTPTRSPQNRGSPGVLKIGDLPESSKRGVSRKERVRVSALTACLHDEGFCAVSMEPRGMSRPRLQYPAAPA